jgi:trans-aconitate methyltransferase
MSYQWNAKNYSKNASAQFGWGMELLQSITLHGDETVLDVGCGDGKVTQVIAESVPHGRVVGMDSSEDMIQFAQETYRDGAPQLVFQHGDASALSYEHEFDLVFSNACLHWVHDHIAVLKGIARALKPGGRALLQMGGTGNVETVRAAVREVNSEEPWVAYFEDVAPSHFFHGDEEYAEWLSLAGLVPSRLKLMPKEMLHTPDEFEGWFRATWLPDIQRVPEERREAFIHHCMDVYQKNNTLDEEGKFHTPVVRLEVLAEKP